MQEDISPILVALLLHLIPSFSEAFVPRRIST